MNVMHVAGIISTYQVIYHAFFTLLAVYLCVFEALVVVISGTSHICSLKNNLSSDAHFDCWNSKHL
jgi:hypothetical protein